MDFAHCFAYTVEKADVQFSLSEELHSEQAMDDTTVVYSHDRTTFLRLLRPSLIFQEMTEVFQVLVNTENMFYPSDMHNVMCL